MLSQKYILISAIIIPIFFSGLLLPSAGGVFADDLEQACAPVADPNFACAGMNSSQCRQFLQQCADYYDQESEKIAEDLTKTAKEKQTLQNQVATLKKKVQGLAYQIKQGNLTISDLKIQINETKSSIDKTSIQIEQSKDQIADVLRNIGEEGDKSVAEILLEGNLSNFFSNVARLEGLNARLKDLLLNTKDLKTYLEGQKNKIDDEKGKVEATVKIQSLQKQASEDNKKQQESLLKLTEEQYQQQLAEKQDADKKANAIKARIFELIGVPKAPTFGEAYEIAKYVSGITGVRPALLLAVLTQESNLGKNVGQCYLTNTKTGAGKRIKNNAAVFRVMSPTRDVPPFLTIVSSLGRDPQETPVSCPMSYGWGGAMGPAQFIPSTWIKYKNRIDSIAGKSGDPWNIKDAFLAAGLYLSDYGGKSRNEDNEWRAAMIYFSGSTSTKYRFYGDSVISLARGYESDIAALGS